MRKVLDKINRERSAPMGSQDRRSPKASLLSASKSTSGSCPSSRAQSPRGRGGSVVSSRSSVVSSRSFGQVQSDVTVGTSYSGDRIVRRQMSPRTRLHTLKLQDSSSGGEPPEPMKSPSTEKLKTILKPRGSKLERQGSKVERQGSKSSPDRA